MKATDKQVDDAIKLYEDLGKKITWDLIVNYFVFCKGLFLTDDQHEMLMETYGE